MKNKDIDKAERGMIHGAVVAEGEGVAPAGALGADGIAGTALSTMPTAPVMNGVDGTVPEMQNTPTHVRQTLPNGRVSYVRRDTVRSTATTTGEGSQDNGGIANAAAGSLTDAHAQDDGAITHHKHHKSPLGLHKLHGVGAK